VVVVQHSETVGVGERRDEQVDRWQAMSDARELCLRVEGALLDSVVQVILGEGKQFGEELIMLLALRAE
jgi:hypothetical protein